MNTTEAQALQQAQEIMTYAEAHYNEGLDYIVECYTIDDLVTEILTEGLTMELVLKVAEVHKERTSLAYENTVSGQPTSTEQEPEELFSQVLPVEEMTYARIYELAMEVAPEAPTEYLQTVTRRVWWCTPDWETTERVSTAIRDLMVSDGYLSDTPGDFLREAIDKAIETI